MVYDFSANDVFEMAIRIESNGAKFYRKAASLQADSQTREMLEELALMEDRHMETFEKMKDLIIDAKRSPTVFDPQDETFLYLAAMADSHKGEGSPSVADALTGDESILEIIDIAIGLEKESILFYLGLKDLALSKAPWITTTIGRDERPSYPLGRCTLYER